MNTFLASYRSSNFLTGSCRFRLKCDAGFRPRASRSCVIRVEPRTSDLMITWEMTRSSLGRASSGRTHSYSRLLIRESSRACSVVTRLMRSIHVFRCSASRRSRRSRKKSVAKRSTRGASSSREYRRIRLDSSSMGFKESCRAGTCLSTCSTRFISSFETSAFRSCCKCTGGLYSRLIVRIS